MGRIRKVNLAALHKTLASSSKRWNSKASFGRYGLVHGMYHSTIVGIEEDIWTLSTNKQRAYLQFIQTNNVNVILKNHQLAVSYFVKQNGTSTQHDIRLSQLLLHAQTLRNQSKEWLNQALQEYQQGRISTDMMLKTLSFMPKKEFFAYITILLAMNIKLQCEAQTDRLNNVLQILERLKEEESCEKHIPLFLIGWFAEQISVLWGTPIKDLLSTKQIKTYLQKHPDKIIQWYERMSMTKADFLNTFIFPNSSFKNFVSDWLKESSVEELKQIEMTYITSPENKTTATYNPDRGYALPSSHKNWDYITILGFHLEEKSGTLSEKSWNIWYKGLAREGRFAITRNRSLRLTPDMLDWMAKHHTENEFKVILKNKAKRGREGIEIRQNIQVKIKELQNINFQEQERVLSKTLSSVFTSLNRFDIEVSEQDQIYHILFPVLKKKETPNTEVFCYLYLHQENHSPSIQQELQSYFTPYFSQDWLYTHDSIFVVGIIGTLTTLLTQLHQKHRVEECQQLYQYIDSLQKLNNLNWFARSSNDYERMTIHWGDIDNAFANIAKPPISVRDMSAVVSDINHRLDYLVKEVCTIPTNTIQMATVLQKRFLFEHPFLNTIKKVERLSALLVQLYKSELLSSRIAVTLLDIFLTIPIQNRFYVLRSVQQTLRSIQLSKWSVQTQGQLQSRMNTLYEQAKTLSEDIFVAVSVKTLEQLSETLQLSKMKQDTEDNNSDSYKQNFEKWKQDALAKIARVPIDGWMESINETMESMRTLLMNKNLLDHQAADILRFGFTVLQDWEHKIEEAEEKTFTLSQPLLTHYPQTLLYIFSTFGHISSELIENFHPNSETQQTIVQVLYEYSKSKYDAKTHLLTMMVLLNQDFSKSQIHQKLLSCLVGDMEQWEWSYDDQQTTIQLVAQYQQWIKMHAFLQNHQVSRSLGICEEQWLSYLDQLPYAYLLDFCVTSKKSTVLPTIDLSDKQKQKLRTRILKSTVVEFPADDLRINIHLFVLHTFPDDHEVIAKLSKTVLSLEQLDVQIEFVSHLSETQYDVFFHVLHENENLRSTMGTLFLVCLNCTKNPDVLLQKFISIVYDNKYMKTITESIQWLDQQEIWTNKQLFECHILFLEKSEISVKYIQNIIESKKLTSEDVWKPLQKVHNQESFLSIVLWGIECGWLEQNKILLELQNKIIMIQKSHWKEAKSNIRSPWEGLEDFIEKGIIIRQTLITLLFTGWDYLVEPLVCTCTGLKQGWYTFEDIKPQLEKRVRNMNLSSLRKLALATMTYIEWETDIVLEFIKNYSQQENKIMVQGIIEACPSLFDS